MKTKKAVYYSLEEIEETIISLLEEWKKTQ